MVQVGDKVLYVPHECHALNRTAQGGFAFVFRHVENGPRWKKGDPIDLSPTNGKPVKLYRGNDDRLRTNAGHVIEPSYPVSAWSATVTAIYPDGSADLDIVHPLGGITLHYPKVRQDSAKGLHTFHISE